MDTLKPLIEELVAMVKSGKDVLSGNIPEVMKQIMAYERWQVLFWIKLCSVAIVFSGFCLRMDFIAASRKANIYGNYENYDHGWFVLVFLVGIPSIIGLCAEYTELKKMQMAPKVYMLDKLHEYLQTE